MNKVENYEEACKITGADPTKEVSKQDKLETMIQGINNNEPATWLDPEKVNYYPLFRVVKDPKKPSGFRLSYHDYDNVRASTIVGSRLTFRSLEGLRYMVDNHIEFYEEVYL
jgi:hypothetical protein